MTYYLDTPLHMVRKTTKTEYCNQKQAYKLKKMGLYYRQNIKYRDITINVVWYVNGSLEVKYFDNFDELVVSMLITQHNSLYKSSIMSILTGTEQEKESLKNELNWVGEKEYHDDMLKLNNEKLLQMEREHEQFLASVKGN